MEGLKTSLARQTMDNPPAPFATYRQAEEHPTIYNVQEKKDMALIQRY